MNYKLYSHRYGVEIVENSIEMSGVMIYCVLNL